MDPTRPDKYRWDVVRMDRELKIPFSETLNEVYLEMPKFVLPLSECKTIYLKWLFVLNNIDIMERLPEELNNQLFQKLKSIVEIERMSADERLEYELSLAVERDMLSALDAKYEDGIIEGEKIGIEKGLQEGLQKGIQKGMEKGLQKGIQKGREEGLQKGIQKGLQEGKVESARNMKSFGFSIADIAKVTGLTFHEIESL